MSVAGANAVRRLIEDWVPMAAIGEESMRERRSMTALPPTYYLHVWWARRPLVACRAAIAASLLPADADREAFLRLLGIHGDPVRARARIDRANKKGKHLGTNVYGYPRAFRHSPSAADIAWFRREWQRLAKRRTKGGKQGRTNTGARAVPVVCDPMAGGGSVPVEAVRLGCTALGNDLNAVAWLIQMATAVWPREFGGAVLDEYRRLADEFHARIERRIAPLFPAGNTNREVNGYLWARTIKCPECGGIVPLSPNWRLSREGHGVRLVPKSRPRACRFVIVDSPTQHSPGTVERGRARCPFPDCGEAISAAEIKAQAQAGTMGATMFAVVEKRRVKVGKYQSRKRAGETRFAWVRHVRAAKKADAKAADVAKLLAKKLPAWEAADLVPREAIPHGDKTAEPQRYGLLRWQQFFAPRQLLVHGFASEVFAELLGEALAAGNGRGPGVVAGQTRAAFAYLALSLDKFLDYNSAMTRWQGDREVIINTFDRHDFSLKWSFAEMPPAIVGRGLRWVLGQTEKALRELIALFAGDAEAASQAAADGESEAAGGGAEIFCASADDCAGIAAGSVDAVVVDPPYFDNVMYAELADFFYVWLRRRVGRLFPEVFADAFTDKTREAVAKRSRFRGQTKPRLRAEGDFRERMTAIFRECRRILRPDGVLTVMFTHKRGTAWEALSAALLTAGFRVTASWPIRCENATSLHIQSRTSATSTVWLVARPVALLSVGARNRRATAESDAVPVRERIAAGVADSIADYRAAGMRGVDVELAGFGAALRAFCAELPATETATVAGVGVADALAIASAIVNGNAARAKR